MTNVDLSTGVNLVSTVALALLTGIYVWLTNRLLKAQIDPCVVVYAKHDDSRPSFVLLVVENVGRSVARNIRFDFSEPIPESAWGISPDEAPTPHEMQSGPLISGIPALAPGDSRRMTWGQYGGIKKMIGDRCVRVTCRFNRMQHAYDLLEEDLTTDCYLDIRSFERTDAVDPDGARQCAQQLQEIRKLMDRAVRSLERNQQPASSQVPADRNRQAP